MIHVDVELEVVFVFIARRIVADGLAFGILGVEFVLVFLDLHGHVPDIGEADQIRIGFFPFRIEIGYDEASVRFVDVELVVIADDPGRIEGSQFLLVLFPVFQLFLDGVHAGPLSSGKPWRELRSAVLAHVSVIQLAVAQKLDFLAADVADLFIE